MTQFAVTITRHVTKCGTELKGTVEVIATPSAVLDANQRYVLESNGWWATSDITANLAANGTSTGLNAASTDSSAKVISNVVGAIGQVAVTAASVAAATPPASGPAPAVAPQPTEKPINVCRDELAAAVEALYPSDPSKKGLRATADEKIALVAASTARVARLTQQSALDKSYRKPLAEALSQHDQLQRDLSDAQRKLSGAVGATTNTQTFRWPLESKVFRADVPFVLDQSVLVEEWLIDGAPKKVVDKAAKDFEIYLALYRADATRQTWSPPRHSAASGEDYGVPVRLASTGRLLACAKASCPLEVPIFGSTDKNHIQFDQVVLQLGQVYTVPLTGGSFRSQSAVVAMDANGLPTTIQVSEKAAAGEALTGALKDAATQAAALPQQIAAAKLAATTAQTNQLNAETNQLNAQAALAAAQVNAGVTGQTAPLVAQTALINAQNALVQAKAAARSEQTLEVSAQTAMLNAQAALITAQANSANAPAIGALTAQTTLINAQTAQVNASAALAKAVATLP